MKFQDFTDEQKQKFTKAFYDYVSFDDTQSPHPWGCPWLWCSDNIASRFFKDVEAGAKEWAAINADEINDLLAREE